MHAYVYMCSTCISKYYYLQEKKFQSSIDEVKTLTEYNKRLEKTQQSLKVRSSFGYNKLLSIHYQSSTIKYQELIKELQDKTEALEIQLVAMRRVRAADNIHVTYTCT